MREREIEKYLVERVKAIGGNAMKWVSPGNSGVPDRIVFLPDGRVHLVECKAPGKKPTPIQERQINRLGAMGHRTYVLDSKEAVDQFLKEVMPHEVHPTPISKTRHRADH
jgi:Holliday junction resolvase